VLAYIHECFCSLAGNRPSARAQGLSVYQWGSAACVQRLGYASAGFPAPGEALLTADRPSGGDIALSGHRKVTYAMLCTKTVCYLTRLHGWWLHSVMAAAHRLCEACCTAGHHMSCGYACKAAPHCCHSWML
jgi:hypothetical protein